MNLHSNIIKVISSKLFQHERICAAKNHDMIKEMGELNLILKIYTPTVYVNIERIF